MSEDCSNYDEDYNEEEEETSQHESEVMDKLDINKITYDEESQVHYLPAKITYNGKCKVDNYFTPLIKENNNGLTCSLRGRKLNGKKKPVKGVSLFFSRFRKKDKKMKTEKVLKIKNYTVWKYDQSIEPGNPFMNVERIIKELNILK